MHDGGALDVRVGEHFVQRRLGRLAVEIQHTDRCRPRSIASPSDGHLCDVDVVPAEDGAHRANDARHVVMMKDEEYPVEISLQAEILHPHQSRHFVAKERARDGVGLLLRGEIDAHR